MKLLKNLFIILLLCFGNNAKSQTICRDTSERFFRINDSFAFYPISSLKSRDGNVITSGFCTNKNAFYGSNAAGYVMKTDYTGNVFWHKKIDSSGHIKISSLIYQTMLELKDSSIIMAGTTNDSLGNDKLIVVTKINYTGSLIWSKVYTSRLVLDVGTATSDYITIQNISEDTITKEIYLLASQKAKGRIITKLSESNGNIIWSKSYHTYNDYGYGTGIKIRTNDIILFATPFDNYNSNFISVTKILKSNGDTIGNKFYTKVDTTGYKTDFGGFAAVTLNSKNGNYLISGQCLGGSNSLLSTFYHSVVIEFDSNFNFFKGYCFKSDIVDNRYNTSVTTFPDGSGLYSMLYYRSGFNTDIYYIQFADGKILKERKKNYLGEGIVNETKAIKLNDGGEFLVRLMGDSINKRNVIEFLKLHLTDTSSFCLGETTKTTSLYPLTFKETNKLRDSTLSNMLEEKVPNKIITSFDITTYKTPACFQVSYCDTLKLIPNKNILCLSQSLQVVARKNKSCGSNVDWNYDTTSIQSVTQINDSTANIKFKKTWSGFIYGSIIGCTTITDSFFVQVLQSPTSLNLGFDFKICPNTKTILNAHSGYASYKWQDGSTDSIFTVTQAGTYFIETKDACGGMYFDTINISYFLPLPITQYDTLKGCNSIIRNGITYTSSTIITDTIKSKNNCDSIYNQHHIIVYQITLKNIIDTFSGCSSAIYKGNTYSTSITFRDTIKTAFGCDSVYNIHQIIVQQYNSKTVVDTILGCNSIVYRGNTYNNNTIIKDTSKTLYGCDSLYSTHYILIQKIIATTVKDTVVGCGKVVYKNKTYLLNDIVNDTIKSSFGCDSIFNIHHIIVHPNPTISVSKDTTICLGDVARLYATSNANVFWANSSINPLIIHPLNDTVCKALAITNFNCKDSATTAVNVQHFTIDVSLSPNPASKGDNIFVTTQSNSNYTIYNWSSNPVVTFFDKTNTTINFKADSNCIIMAKALSDKGCKDSTYEELIVRPNPASIFIPNVFSPNNDNTNDYWIIKNFNLFAGTTVTVFNRYGQKVFNSIGYNKPWNGKYMNTGEPLPLGVYYYIITIGGQLANNYTGTVTILR